MSKRKEVSGGGQGRGRKQQRQGEGCRSIEDMVCENCQQKLSKVVMPDKWKEGASDITKGGGQKLMRTSFKACNTDGLHTV
ncbi:hypothetical protein CY35_17G087100 [Sphagnum magellanicum]|nr:hypothetical protein CY35_17G087100 [Sphagnum magellanicum]